MRLADSGDAYANLALGVVNADTLAGAAANLFLVSETVEWKSARTSWLHSASASWWRRIHIARKSGISLGWREIQGYHNTAFNQHHIPLDAWTPNYALNLLESDADKENALERPARKQFARCVGRGRGQRPDQRRAGRWRYAYAYLARLTSAGAFATAFNSNEFGLYEVVTDEGTHVIGHDAGSGLIGGTGGTDVVMGFDGDDVLSGGDGADYLHGGRGNDFLLGGAGVDELSGDEGKDIIDGGEGDDVVFLSDDGDADIVIVGEGQDRIVGGDAFDRLVIRASNF